MTRQEAQAYLKRYEDQIKDDDAKHHPPVPISQHITAALLLRIGLHGKMFPDDKAMEPPRIKAPAPKKRGRPKGSKNKVKK